MENAQINPDESAVVALGCNLAGAYASREALLEAALRRFADLGLTVLTCSGWWESAAWPDPSAPAYLNGVALLAPEPGPEDMLAALHAIERAFGRARGEPNAPRTLDLDLIAHGRTVLDGPDLVLPHPRAHERAGLAASCLRGQREDDGGGGDGRTGCGALLSRDIPPRPCGVAQWGAKLYVSRLPR
jgi:2-amino-4-hydroxy-6-hydroxymethyldihydropteridine diphosphokinase